MVGGTSRGPSVSPNYCGNPPLRRSRSALLPPTNMDETSTPITQQQVSRKLTVLLHLLEEFDNDLGGRADEDLPLAALLGVGDCLETIGEY